MPRLRTTAAVLTAAGLVLASGMAATVSASAVAPRHEVGGAELALPGIHTKAKPGKTPSAVPDVGESWVIADATTGEVLAAKNAHEELLPASTLKTLTAVTLLPRLDPQSTYTPVYADVAADGSKVGIVNGSTYTIDQLWYGLFLASGNDTAHALARANGGMAKTVSEMNAKAAQLQANDTVAKTPSGLDAKGQHSSAYDLALISRAGLKMPMFARYCGTVKVAFPAGGKTIGKTPKGKKKRKTFMTYNHNPLLIGGYKGAIGVKTGYTDAARRTFVGAAKRGNRTLIVTIMKYEGNTYRSGAALLDWGFKNASKVEPVGQLVDPLPADGTKAVSKTSSASSTSTAGIGGSSSKTPPLWPFLVVGIAFLGIVVWALRGRMSLPESDPLAAANKGLGGKANKPRGRGGPRSY